MENHPGAGIDSWGYGLPYSNVWRDLENSLTLPSLLPSPLGAVMKAICLTLARDTFSVGVDAGAGANLSPSCSKTCFKVGCGLSTCRPSLEVLPSSFCRPHFQLKQDHSSPAGKGSHPGMTSTSTKWFSGFGKRGLWEKGSFQKSPFSRDSRDRREPPDWKTKENLTICRDSRECGDFRDSGESRVLTYCHYKSWGASHSV